MNSPQEPKTTQTNSRRIVRLAMCLLILPVLLWVGVYVRSSLQQINKRYDEATIGKSSRNPAILKAVAKGAPKRDYYLGATTWNLDRSKLAKDQKSVLVWMDGCGLKDSPTTLADMWLTQEADSEDWGDPDPYSYYGADADGARLRYGTFIGMNPGYQIDATFNKMRHEAESVTFPGSHPALPSIASIMLVEFDFDDTQGTAFEPISIFVSVHLDHNGEARHLQAALLIERLRPYRLAHERPLPMVVAGDFNTAWEEGGVLPMLCDALDLHAWEHNSSDPELITYKNQRIDWILVGKELAFETHCTVEGEESKHKIIRSRLAYTL